RPPPTGARRHVRLKDGPFGIGQIGFVTGGSSTMLLTGGRGPHGDLQRVSATPWNPIGPDHSTSRSRVTTSPQPRTNAEFRNRLLAPNVRPVGSLVPPGGARRCRRRR